MADKRSGSVGQFAPSQWEIIFLDTYFTPVSKPWQWSASGLLAGG
jgi:hypothetical protein